MEEEKKINHTISRPLLHLPIQYCKEGKGNMAVPTHYHEAQPVIHSVNPATFWLMLWFFQYVHCVMHHTVCE